MPSAPPAVAPRAVTVRVRGARTYQSYAWYDARRVAVPAGTAFSEVTRFPGRPDALILTSTATNMRFRVRNLTEPAGEIIATGSEGTLELPFGADIVEVQDPTGVGGQIVSVVGLYASRSFARQPDHGGEY